LPIGEFPKVDFFFHQGRKENNEFLTLTISNINSKFHEILKTKKWYTKAVLKQVHRLFITNDPVDDSL
jgi:hypothetical protein